MGCPLPPKALSEAATGAWQSAASLSPCSLPLGLTCWCISLAERFGRDQRERVDFTFTVFLFASDKPRRECCPSLWFGLAASSEAVGCGSVVEGLRWKLETWMLFSTLALVWCGLEQISPQP